MSVADVVVSLRWRVGSPLQRGLWAINPKEGADIFVGVVGNATVAQVVCEQHNETLSKGTPQQQ
jgi:hypothetical protein